MLEIFIVLNEKDKQKDQGRGKTCNRGKKEKRRGQEKQHFFFKK